MGDPSTGADYVSGGPDEDSVMYTSKTTPVTVDLRDNGWLDGNSTDDDGAGNLDNIASDVEDVTLGNGGGTVFGNASNNKLTGGNGDDAFYGREGVDTLSGVGGNDTMHAEGDGEADHVSCGTGTDSAFADPVDLGPSTALLVASASDCDTVANS